MTLKQLKTISIASPIAAAVLLEVTRTLLVGVMAPWRRLLLDGVAVGVMIVFALVMFRFIDNMQQRLQRQNDELQALHVAGLGVASELDLDGVLDRVVNYATLLVGAKYGALSVIGENGRIEAFITAGVTPGERAAIGPPPVGHGVLGEVLYEGHHLRLEDLTKHPRSVGFPPNHPPMRSLLAVPITCKGPFKGNLYLADKLAGGTFTGDDEKTLERFAVQAAIAIDNAHLHAQVGDLAVAQERIRIAHEMHDGLAQVLGYVNTKVQAADAYLRRGKTEDAQQQLHELATSAREAYTDVRESIVALRTLPDAERSLTDVLREYAERWREQSGIALDLFIDPDVRLRPAFELQLIRIVQEALTNVRKHARASKARVDIRRDGENLCAVIADDGSGFDTATRARGDFPRFGLTTMRERAEGVGGALKIDSAPGHGTTVTLTLPLRLSAAESA